MTQRAGRAARLGPGTVVRCRIDAVFDGPAGPEVVDWKTGRPPRSEQDLAEASVFELSDLGELAPNLTGQSRGQLAMLAEQIGLVDAARRMTSGRDWRDRLQGVRLLSAVGGGGELVSELMDDPHPAVRAADATSSPIEAIPRPRSTSVASAAITSRTTSVASTSRP